ncbi:MAG: DUF5985 family protein [Actinomycetota bacterium]
MANVVYLLCALTSIACALLLIRGYARTKAKLLLWSSVCFLALVVNNLFLVLDRIFFTNVDLFVFRQVAAFLGLAILVYGLIWDVE